MMGIGRIFERTVRLPHDASHAIRPRTCDPQLKSEDLRNLLLRVSPQQLIGCRAYDLVSFVTPCEGRTGGN